MDKLSVVISAFNEEKNVKDCLESVKWADEIVFIDNTSQDKTLEIAKKYTSKIFTRPNNLMLNINKNFGFEKAQGEWILSLDADEQVTPELKEEIKSSIINNKSSINGYRIPRKNIIFGKWIQHTGWYPDYQLRLFRRGKGKFAEKHVHEQLDVDSEADVLNEHLLHLNYSSVAQFFYKMNQIYIPNEAQNILDVGKKVVWQDAVSWPTQEFLKRFFAEEGWKDGLHGLILSLLMAFYHLLVFIHIWEKQGFWEVREKDFPRAVEDEFGKTGKEFSYWLKDTKIKNTQNPLEKIYLKLKRKAS